jgi:methyl-accepting chemotaxis protein
MEQSGIKRFAVVADEIRKPSTGGVKTVSDQEANIRNAMEEQGAGSRQILEAISRLNDITQKIRGASDEMPQGSREGCPFQNRGR